MNRAFKTEFYNGSFDKPPIITLSVRVNNGKKFKNLDGEGRDNLVKALKGFRDQVEAFTKEIEEAKYQR